MRRICFLALLALLTPFVTQAQTSKKTPTPPPANVPRPAPEFVWSSVNGKVRKLRDLRGQPVVLIFATTPDQKEFKKQVKQISRRYKVLAARNVLFFVAFTKETGVISRSDVPFVVLPDPLTVADLYRVGDFGIALISPDGNLDYATDRVITGQKIVDVVNNSYTAQTRERRD
jgi:AhpC/TSA family